MKTIPREDLTKTCTTCGKEKLLTAFVPKTDKVIAELVNRDDPRLLVHSRCKECYNKYHVKWRAEQGDRYRNKMKARHHERRAKMSPEELMRAKAHDSLKTKNRYAEMKNLVYNAYGGYKCACCGETEVSFLTIDHVNNDGGHMRKNVHGSTGTRTLQWLVNNNFPEGYQILCWNCQWGKQKNNGICPHQITRNDYLERE